MTTTRTATASTSDGPMRLFDAVSAGPPRGGVVVIQEAFGVTPHIESVCQRFASAGWRTVAPHLFHRSGDPTLTYEDFPAARAQMDTLTPDGLLGDLDASLKYLADLGLPLHRASVVGFCMGGTVAFLAAARRPMAATVTFYGGGVGKGRFGLPPLVELAGGLQAPWLGLYGDKDKSIPVEDVERLRTATTTLAVPTEVVRYPEAGHAFHCDDRPTAYHQRSAADAWMRTLAWLDEHVPAEL